LKKGRGREESGERWKRGEGRGGGRDSWGWREREGVEGEAKTNRGGPERKR